MLYRCNLCGFIHEGEMPDGYFCPLCSANYHEFKIIIHDKKSNCISVAEDNPCITKDTEKCINCGICVKTCEYTANIIHCLNCGQCLLTCPTEALIPKYSYREVLDLIKTSEKMIVAMISPSTILSLGEAFDYLNDNFLEGKIISALKHIGFDYVYNASFAADVAAIEIALELKKRVSKNKLPLLNNNCLSWVKYLTYYHPELKDNLSNIKTPIEIEASLLRKVYAKEEHIDEKNLVIVAFTSCVSKKEEPINTDCDYVLTTRELAHLIKEEKIDLKELKDLPFDYLIASSSGYNFDTSGGLMLSVLRTYYYNETNKHLTKEELLIRKKNYGIEYSIKINNNILKGAVISRVNNFEKLVSNLEDYVFIEIMSCEDGCINGGGQIVIPNKNIVDVISLRKKELLKIEKRTDIKYPYQNPVVKELYSEYLKKEDDLFRNIK